MSEQGSYSLKEAHRKFAVGFFNQIWPLLDKTDRTEDENMRLIHLAHASYLHWSEVGEPINRQRGEWMLSRVYSVLGHAAFAVQHAKRCLQLTEEHGFQDFDLAYAYEAMTRALALEGDLAESERYRTLARQAGEAIKDSQDKALFVKDLES